MSSVASSEQVDREELPRLRAAIALLRDRTCCGIEWSYPDALILEFDDHSCSSRWSLQTEDSDWILLSNTEIVARRGDPRQRTIDNFQLVVGARITSAEARRIDYALSVNFDGGARFAILPAQRAPVQVPNDLPIWELAMPEGVTGQTMMVQQNGFVDVVPSDVPLRDLYARGLLRA